MTIPGILADVFIPVSTKLTMLRIVRRARPVRVDGRRTRSVNAPALLS
jgi:hypothetical protein